jgi:hypothetical protein
VCYDDSGRTYGTASLIASPILLGKERTMEDKGFFGALFDLSFSEFVTIRFIRILYIIFIFLIAIGFIFGLIGGVVSMFSDSFWSGLWKIIVAPIGAVISLVLTRIWLEILVVVFRIAENTTDLVELKKQQ